MDEEEVMSMSTSSSDEDDKATKLSMHLNESAEMAPLDFSMSPAVVEEEQHQQNQHEEEEENTTAKISNIGENPPCAKKRTNSIIVTKTKYSNNSVVNSVMKSLDLVQKYSATFKERKYNALPKFHKSELTLGKMLGEGSYSSVFEIKSIQLSEIEDENTKKIPFSASTLPITDDDDDYNQDKVFIATHCLRLHDTTSTNHEFNSKKHGDSRYAIKFLKSEIMNKQLNYQRGAIDIAREGAILSSLSHPNIIRLRGLSSDGPTGFAYKKTGNYFLILDRLYDTLEKRMEKWSSSCKGLGLTDNIKSLFGSSKSSKSILKKKRMLLVQRLLVAYDLAQALQYLHKRNIMYRDLKPENIGFDVRGEVKLFDFGLAIELHPEQRMKNGLYNLSGNVGTPRYMAPEIIKHQPYDLSIDIYSFGILLWQMCNLKIPFEEYTNIEGFNAAIISNKRPNFTRKQKKLVPTKLQELIISCWQPNIHERPMISVLILKLKEEMQFLQSENDHNNNDQCSATAGRLDDRYYRRRSSTNMSGRLSISSQES